MANFTTTYDQDIAPLMEKVDQVRSVLGSSLSDINFPTVVVVGDQSSGKSTLLEALSLVELPKGAGIVTRCPLVLRLRKGEKRSVYRIVNHNDKELLDTDNINISNYIMEETRKIAGDQKNVVKDLIELQVEDPSLRSLTVVDLPGIARNPVADQPKDIHKQTVDLIHHFIKREESVILCVCPANVDMATVESFSLAKGVDPDGKRTIGVITKTDLCPNEDNLVQQLLMEKDEVLKLALGFIAVRNRDGKEEISIEDARTREREYFRNQQVFEVVDQQCLGIDALINRLADLYRDRISEAFPKMQRQVQLKLEEVRAELEKFPPILDTAAAKYAVYYDLIEYYVRNIIQKRLVASEDGITNGMINFLQKQFVKAQETAMQSDKDMLNKDFPNRLKVMLDAHAGEQLPNFLAQPILKREIQKKLDEFFIVIDGLIQANFKHLQSRLLTHDNDALREKMLLNKILPVFRQNTQNYLKEKESTTRASLSELFRLEKCDPYTLGDDYYDDLTEIRSAMREKTGKEEKIPQSLPPHVSQIKSLLQSYDINVCDMFISIYAYWKLVTKRILEHTALMLRASCYFDIADGVQKRLRSLPSQNNNLVDFYLSEDSKTQNHRLSLQQKRKRLEQVSEIIGVNLRIDSYGDN